MKQVHLYISGFVQGVGFRNFVRSKAKQLKLTGWVRNLSDNRVEAVVQGSENELKKFIDIVSKEHFLSEVKNVSVAWEEATDKFETFEKKETL